MQTLADINSPLRAICTGKVLMLGVLGLCVFISAMGLVYTKHLSRHLHVALQAEQQKRDELQVEWSRLLLEQSTLASDLHVEKIAKETLHMIIPKPQQIRVIRP